MAGKRHDDGRVCLCDRPDGTCAGLAVKRLSRDRVRDLAEEIWTASSGFARRSAPTATRGPAGPAPPPRPPTAGAARPSASAGGRAGPGGGGRSPAPPWRRAGDRPDRRRLAGLAGGRRGGGDRLVAAALPPSPGVAIWKRQAAMQRRTAAVLRPLGEEGYLVLHDITLPGWLDSLDHLVVGPTGLGGSSPGGPGGRCRAPPPRPRPLAASAGRPRPWPGSWPAGPVSRSGPCCACTAAGRSGPGPPTASGWRPRPAPRHRPRRPHDPAHRPRAGHQPPPRRPATGGMT